jgi:hypothetical protein
MSVVALLASNHVSADDLSILVVIIAVALLCLAVWLGVHHNIPGAAVAVVVALLLLLFLA